MRRQARRLLARLLDRRCRRDAPAIDASAVVVAPHFDDEVLGCGGTILLKRAVGASVGIVFMTDGGKSHRHLMPESDLCRLRAKEALVAAHALDVAPENLHLLDYPEGTLDERAVAATDTIAKILVASRPAQLFIPYRADGQADHEATNRIARAALEASKLTCRVYEYPIWAWHNWPWSPLRLDSRGDIVHVAPRTLLANLRLLLKFNAALAITDVLGRKQAALAAYRSQMTRLIDDPRWLTLADVGEGEFLDNLMTNRECFYGY